MQRERETQQEMRMTSKRILWGLVKARATPMEIAPDGMTTAWDEEEEDGY